MMLHKIDALEIQFSKISGVSFQHFVLAVVAVYFLFFIFYFFAESNFHKSLENRRNSRELDLAFKISCHTIVFKSSQHNALVIENL